MMDKFEKQFEQLDVQTQVMDETMSASTTLTVPQVGHTCILYGLVHVLLKCTFVFLLYTATMVK